MSISDNFREAAYSQETNESIIILLTLYSEDETLEKMYVCDTPVEKYADLGENMYGVTSNEQKYLFVPFSLTLPQDDSTGVVTAKLSIQNVDRSIVPYVRQINDKILMDVQVVLSSTPDVVELTYKGFELTNVNYDAFNITATLGYAFLENEPFPSGRFYPSNFPGIF